MAFADPKSGVISVEQVPYRCPLCNGSGVEFSPLYPTGTECHGCAGTGVIYTTRTTTYN